MCPTLVMVLLAGVPKAPPDAELVVYVPHLDALSTVTPFFRAAGSRSPLMRVESWRGSALPLLAVDVTSQESLSAAGIDPKGPLTVSKVAERTVSCVALGDAARYAKRVSETLGAMGKITTRQESGVPISLVRDSLDRVLAAVATQGRESCVVVGDGLSVEKQLPLLARALVKPASPPGAALGDKLPGVATAFVADGARTGALSVSAKGLRLTMDARARGLRLHPLQGAGASPYASFAPEGMAVLRARFAPSGMPALAGEIARDLPMATLTPLAAELGALLTGNTAVVVSHVSVTSGLRSPAARFFATRVAFLAETRDPDAARRLLDALDRKGLSLREGRVDVTVEGSTIILSNDETVKARALAALASSAGQQAHAAELIATPPLVARGLSQVPLLEVVQAPELALVLTVSTELGGLFLASESFTGWVDPAGAGLHRAQATWVLDARRFATDQGSTQ